MAIAKPDADEVRDALSRPMSVIDITTTGRKSGKPRRLEIVLHSLDGRLYISGMPRPERRGWLHNLEADPHLIIHLKRGIRADIAATAREITDPKERRKVLEGVAAHWKRRDIDTMMRYSPLIEVTVQDN